MMSETFGEICERLNGQIGEMQREREQCHQEWLAVQAKLPRQPMLSEIMGVLQQLVAEVTQLQTAQSPRRTG